MRTRVRTLVTLTSILGVAALTALLLYAQVEGNLTPIRVVQDPFPVFTDVAVDPQSNIVAVSDENLFSLRTYERNDPNAVAGAVSDPKTVISGPKSMIDFVCGVAIDPINQEIFAANNDTASILMTFKYGDTGEVPPARELSTASTGTWGVALDSKNNEVAVTIEHINKVQVYRREAIGEEKPLRI